MAVTRRGRHELVLHASPHPCMREPRGSGGEIVLIVKLMDGARGRIEKRSDVEAMATPPVDGNVSFTGNRGCAITHFE